MKPTRRQPAIQHVTTAAPNPNALCSSNIQVAYASTPDTSLTTFVEPPKPTHPTPTNPAEELLTKRELAVRLKKTPRCIEQWMRRRYLPYIKIGHTVLFRWRDVLEALERMTIR